MLKALLLQQLYALSDVGLEEAINDRVSFRKFLGLSLEAPSPDHTTWCRFCNRLFGEFERQLDQRGLIVKRGTMIDASLIETPFRPGSGDGKRRPVDPDAANITRAGRARGHYGHKVHAGVDLGSRLIWRLLLTPANVHDMVLPDRLVCGDEQAVYADRGYAKRARNQWLRA